MGVKLVISLAFMTLVAGQDSVGVVVEPNNSVGSGEDSLNETDVVLAFVIFRHGDRTPDDEELDLYPDAHIDGKDLFFPYGKKALTNKGKQRGFLVGQYLRQRYDGFISRLYLPDEISIRTTSYARTQMTALTALAALYPPPPAQRWNPALDWQPVPYDTVPFHEDDLMYWYNCPRYIWLRNKVYELPETQPLIGQYRELFNYLAEKVGRNISTTEDVFFLDNLFQTLNNVGVATPQWALDVMDQITAVTDLEYDFEFYNTELTKIASGVVMADLVNASSYAILGELDMPKLRLISAHENNVAALMSAAKVFTPHQPSYGSTFSIELRKDRNTGKYGFAAVYSAQAGGPGEVIPVQGCGGKALCDYDTFLSLTHDVIWSHEEFRKQCPSMN